MPQICSPEAGGIAQVRGDQRQESHMNAQLQQWETGWDVLCHRMPDPNPAGACSKHSPALDPSSGAHFWGCLPTRLQLGTPGCSRLHHQHLGSQGPGERPPFWRSELHCNCVYMRFTWEHLGPRGALESPSVSPPSPDTWSISRWSH